MSSLGARAQSVGQISFTLGQVERINAQGHKDLLKKDAPISVGDRIVTGSGGHAHIRFIDQGFVSVRPNSSLSIDAYSYDRQEPKNSEVKFTLHQGVARSISGQAAQSAKDRYRLNTPTAAIGIRGTDFVVSTAADVTRVMVQSGSIVLAPLSEACRAQALGPCDGVASRVLTAAMRNAYLELRARDAVPVLMTPDRAIESPNKVAPPRPEEPKVQADKAAAMGTSTSVGEAVPEVITTKVKSAIHMFQPEIWWGRWSNVAALGLPDDTRVTQLLVGGRELGPGNNFYGIVRNNLVSDLPRVGSVSFKLFDGEAYLLNAKTVSPLVIQDASLNVNFETRRFDTHLNLSPIASSTNNANLIPIDVGGVVTFDGFLLGNSNTQNSSVSGMLSNSKNQAAYVFDKNLTNGTQAIGVTRWQR
jgi:preprotein translocase subunit YajC